MCVISVIEQNNFHFCQSEERVMTVEKSLSNALSRETILAIDKNGKGFQSIRFRMMKCSRYSMIATLPIVEFTCLLVRPPRAASQSFALPPLPGSPPSPQGEGLDQCRGWFCSVRGSRTSGTAKSHPVNYQFLHSVLCNPHTGCWYLLSILHALYACFCCLVAHLKLLATSTAFEGCLFFPQLNMLLWQHPTIHCLISMHPGEDSPSLEYCIIPFQHTPAPKGLWCVNPHFLYKSVLYQLASPEDSRRWASLH